MAYASSKKTFFVAAILLVGAILGSAYLVYVSANIGAVGCAAGGSCDAVLASRWSQFMGLSVAVFGGLSYVALLGCIFKNRTGGSPLFLSAQVALSVSILMAAAWFVLIQQFALGAYCYRCCLVHGMASVAAVLSLIMVGVKVKPIVWKSGLAIGWIAFVGFAGGQMLQKVKIKSHTHVAEVVTISQDGEAIHFHGEKESVQLEDLPLLVDSDAEKYGFLLMDYTCAHCLEYLEQLLSNESKVSEVGRLYVLPAYHSKSARDLHRVMLTVGRLDKAIYRDLLTAMVKNEVALDPRQLKLLANSKLSGRYGYYQQRFLRWSEDILKLGERVMQKNESEHNVVVLPQLIAGGEVAEGKMEFADLLKLIGVARYEKYLEGESATAISREESAIVVIDGTHDDVQRIFKNESAKGVVRLKNTSDATEVLEVVKVTCGCIQLDDSLFPMSLGPEEVVELPYVFHTKKFLGEVTHKIIMSQKGEARKKVIVPITVDVWLPFRISPYGLNLGILERGETGKVRVAQLFVEESEKVLVSLSNKEQLAQMGLNVELKTIIAGRHYELRAQVAKMGGDSVDAFAVLKTSHPEAPEVKLPIKAQLKVRE